ncbi:MAG TPA: hypothetical protein VIL42_09380 [Sphingomicrobium sp.]
MVDEIYDRNYQAGRAEMNRALDAGFARLGRAIVATLEALHRIEFDAPWREQPKRVRPH